MMRDKALRAAQQQLDASRLKYGCAWIRSHWLIDWLRG